MKVLVRQRDWLFALELLGLDRETVVAWSVDKEEAECESETDPETLSRRLS